MKDFTIVQLGRLRISFAWYDLWIGVYPPSQKTTGLPVDECQNQLRWMSPPYNVADNPPKPWRRRVSYGPMALAVGLHIDRQKKILYICPLPTILFTIKF